MRPFWPYAKDKATIQLLKKEVPFKVAACWNGAVVFPSEPYLWRESDTPPLAEGVDFSPLLGKRGWKMIDLRTPILTSLKQSQRLIVSWTF